MLKKRKKKRKKKLGKTRHSLAHTRVRSISQSSEGCSSKKLLTCRMHAFIANE